MVSRPATAIVYPETDGMPLPDGEYQAPIYRKVVGALEVHFNNVPGAWVNGNTFIYYVEGNPRRSVSPDCYVAFNLSEAARHSLSIEANNTYLLWEVGKAPDFVLEIASESTATVDLGRKRDLYAEIGVSEYWRYDETGSDFYGEPLVGERLMDGEYQRLEMHEEADGRVWAHSDALNLDLWWIEGELRFWDNSAGKWLLNYVEEQAARLAAEDARLAAEDARLSAEDARLAAEERAQAERAGRLAAEARLAEMEAELLRLRGE